MAHAQHSVTTWVPSNRDRVVFLAARLPAEYQQKGGKSGDVCDRDRPAFTAATARSSVLPGTCCRSRLPPRTRTRASIRRIRRHRRARPSRSRPASSASAVSGMLSKNDDTNPRASAFCQDGDGNDSTGISEAEATRQRRKTDPFTAPGRMLQSGRRQPAVSAMAAATAVPMNGKRDEISGCVAFTPTLTDDGARQDEDDDRHARPVNHVRGLCVPDDRGIALLRLGRLKAEHEERGGRGDVGVQDFAWRHAIDPHHRRRRVADDAARSARVR